MAAREGVALWLLLSLCAWATMAQSPPPAVETEDTEVPPPVGEYEILINITKATMAGLYGSLAQAVRIPKSAFGVSSCQLVYLANPDWSTSTVQVDFGSSGSLDGTCTRQAFLAYIDNYDKVKGVSGMNKAIKVPWTSILTTPRASSDDTPAAPRRRPTDASPPPEAPTTFGSPPPPSSSDPPSGQSGAGASRRLLYEFGEPLDRSSFGSDFDSIRGVDAVGILFSELGGSKYIPGPGSYISKPVMASAFGQVVSTVPSDPRPFLEYVELKATGDLDPSSEEIAGMASGDARIYTPLLTECQDILSGNTVLTPVATTSSSPGAQSFTLVGTSQPRDSCFVTQQVVVIFNNCTASAAATAKSKSSSGSSSSGGGGNASSSGVPARTAEETCGRAAATGATSDRIACVLEYELERTAAKLGLDPTEDYVKVTVTYQPYDACYYKSAVKLGQAMTLLSIVTGVLMFLLVLVTLLPTFYRLFIEFPIRCIVFLVRKLCCHSRVGSLPMQASLNSHKEPLAWLSCGRVPVLAQLCYVRKQLVYTLTTVHHPDGQYRALQVAVTSVVALLVTVVAYPPSVDPLLEYYIPPLTFRILKYNGDPLNTVWFFLQLLVYALFLGFVGYMSLLANYNTPQNRYYVAQCCLSVFWLAVLNALVLVQLAGVLRFWDQLSNKWPWVPMSVFMLGNLAVADVLQLITMISRRDRNDERRRLEYLALLREVAAREERAAAKRYQLAKVPADGGSVVTAAPVVTAAAIITAAGPVAEAAEPEADGTYPTASADGDPAAQPSQGIGRHRQRMSATDRNPAAAAAVAPAPFSMRTPQPPGVPPPPSSSMSSSLRTRMGPAAEGSSPSTATPTGAGSARRVASLAPDSADMPPSRDDEGTSRGGSSAVGGRGFYDVYKAAEADAAAVVAGAGADGVEESGMLVPPSGDSEGSMALAGKGKGKGSEAKHGALSHTLRGLLRSFLRMLSEDAAFKYPAWFLASVLIAAYVLVFTYAKAMVWANNIEHCIGDPTDCLNQQINKYVLFTSRLVSRDQQDQVYGYVTQVANTREAVQAAVNSALANNDTLGAGLLNSNSTSNLTAALLNRTALSSVNLSAVRDTVSAQVTQQLSVNLTSILSDTLPPELVALLPQNVTEALQARMTSAVNASVSRATDALHSAASTLVTQALPSALAQQNRLLQALNASLVPLYNAVDKTSTYMGQAIVIEGELISWKDGLHKRFFGCSVAGFTLGLCLGLFSLLQIMIAFRESSRKVRMTRMSYRFFAQPKSSGHGASERRPLLPAAGEGEVEGGGEDDGSEAAAPLTVEAMYNPEHDPENIVFKVLHEGISNTVYFMGVLLSVTVIQLYVVGVALTVGTAVVTHPWLWTWCFPRYYMWLVAILIGLIAMKVFLIGYVGHMWLTNGDRIHRPAAWLAFLVIVSAMNLIIGLLLALFRIVLLLLTTILTLGKLDVSIFTILPMLDLPHRTFLAGIHLHESMRRFNDPIYLPGPRGRAHRRWRKLRHVVLAVPTAELRELLNPQLVRKSSKSKTGRKGSDPTIVKLHMHDSAFVPPELVEPPRAD